MKTMISMQDRQSQLVLRRRQQINRQQQLINSPSSNYSNSIWKGERGCHDQDDSRQYCGRETLSFDNAASYRIMDEKEADTVDVDVSFHSSGNDSQMSSPTRQQQRADDKGTTAHSPCELTCISTSIKHTRDVIKRETDDESSLDDSKSLNENPSDSEKENKEALHRLERELDSKTKELEETRAKLEAKGDDADRLRAELEQWRQLQAVQDGDSILAYTDQHHHDGKLNEIPNVTTTHHSSGSDSGYQRYLNTYHHRQPQKTFLSQQSDEITTDILDDLTESNQGTRRLSSISSVRPLSRRAARPWTRQSSQESSSSSSALFAMAMSTPAAPTTAPSSKSTEERRGDENAQEQHLLIFDTDSSFHRREFSSARNSPLLQQQLTFIESANLDDPVVMRSILMNPSPKGGGMIQCCIRRNKGIGLFPEYRCYLRGDNNSRTETFLMTSKKRSGNKTSNYLISMGHNDHDKDSVNILGKLRANFAGTEYMIYDNGINPINNSHDGKNNDDYGGGGGGTGDARVELGAVVYAPHSTFGAKGPRSITVGISNIDEQDNPVGVWQPLHKLDDSMMNCLKKMIEEKEAAPARSSTSSMDKLLLRFESKAPAWDESLQRFFLNFNGRVTMASVKNYQLVDSNGDVCLQFGRIGKDEFILDVQWPLSPFQAFALALSSFDSKVGCD
jgi:tubby-related protein 1